MGFLDNSGDIILDAVLTDAGRARLARGDGSFRITKFALGDDEINYSLYDKNNQSGSAYFDIDIMQTPVFEAFTNNIASLNSRLITFSRMNLMYLPVLKPNYKEPGAEYAISDIVQNGYILAVDEDTETMLNTSGLTYGPSNTPLSSKGILKGITTKDGSFIKIDQGIDNSEMPASTVIDQDLLEVNYLVEVDNRFAAITNKTNDKDLQASYVDDDDMAAYYFSLGDQSAMVTSLGVATGKDSGNNVIDGQRGTTLSLKLRSQAEVSTSDYLFQQLGTDVTSQFKINGSAAANNIRSVLTTVRITGLTTGYAIDIPVVLLKKIS